MQIAKRCDAKHLSSAALFRKDRRAHFHPFQGPARAVPRRHVFCPYTLSTLGNLSREKGFDDSYHATAQDRS